MKVARRLVTVRRVGDIKPIKGADRIEVAVVDGWNCIVKKGEFVPDDYGLFFEIDSFLPSADSRWSFLEKNFINWNNCKGFRVKSTKMKGQISQGLLMPLDMFPEITAILSEFEDEHSNDQVQEKHRDMSFEDILKVVQWEAMDSTSGNWRAANTEPFPSFLSRTDQERVQNLTGVFDDWKDEIFQETTKMDGSSMTVYFLREDSERLQLLSEPNVNEQPNTILSNGRFGVCSRHIDLREHDANGQRFWQVAKKHNLAAKLSELNRNIALQGELCGSSIQRNFEGFPKDFHDFFLFSVWDIDEQEYLKPREAEIIANELEIKHTPVHGYFRLRDIATNVDELLARAEGKGLNGKKREGIVLKHVDGGFSFKVISNSYLLKHGE